MNEERSYLKRLLNIQVVDDRICCNNYDPLTNSDRISHMIAHSGHWKNIITEGDFTQKVQTVLTTEAQMQDTLTLIEKELLKIRTELE